MVLTTNRWHICTLSQHSNTHNKTHFFSLSEKKYFVTWKTLHLHSSGHVTWKLWVGLLGEFISLIRDYLSCNLKIMVNAFRNSSLSMASQLCMAKSCTCAMKSTTGRSMLCILLFSCEVFCVDSERQSQTGAEGDRFKEAVNINQSLSTLGNVLKGESYTSYSSNLNLY